MIGTARWRESKAASRCKYSCSQRQVILSEKLPLHLSCPHKGNYDGQKQMALDLQAFKDPDPLQFLGNTKEMPSV